MAANSGSWWPLDQRVTESGLETTDSRVTEFIREKYRPLTPGLAELRRICEKDQIPVIYPETETLLLLLLRLKQPKKILEIGTALGYSASFFAEAVKGSTVYTVEKDEYACTAARQNIRAGGLEGRVRVYLGDGQEITEKLRDDGEGPFDFVFIDAAKSHYRRFFESALTCASDGAVLVSDNILLHGMTVDEDSDPKKKHRTNIRRMRDFLEFITTDPRLETTLQSSGDGVAISLYHKKK
ncbi:MAG: O-methyltransferase [Anaerovoracaceae bacterium]|jgi:predicted O-methyltransferase YrrM